MKTWIKTDTDGFATQISFSEFPPDDSWINDDTYQINSKPGFKYNVATKEWIEDPIATQNALSASIKSTRNSLLVNSDWTQIPNSPLSAAQQQAWATYRQALRDIPGQPGFPTTVTWPQIPS